MPSSFNWEPFITTAELFAAFVAICFLATVSDLWFKGARKGRKPAEPIAWQNGEKVYLN